MSHDSELRTAVQQELSWEPSIVSAHIGVTADAGVVTLTGHVGNFAQKHAAEDAAKRVKGVKAVAEEIEVRLLPESNRTDDQIAAAILDRLAWNVTFPRDAAKVTVENGWVTLTGEVDWHFQKEAAGQDVRRLFGVVGVSNQLTVKARVDTSSISSNIRSSLNRSWFYGPEAVTVTADGGRVNLRGHVHTIHERDSAAHTAWAASGVTTVENDIIVA